MNRRIIGATVGTPISPQKIVEQLNIDTKANAIINSASGEIILTTDSANMPLVGMKTFGKSWIETVACNQLLTYPYVTDTSNLYGVNVTANADGSIYANGTSNGYGYFDLYAKNMFVLPKGTYTLSKNVTQVANLEIYLEDIGGIGGSDVYTISPSQTSVTFTVEYDSYASVYLCIEYGLTYYETIYPMLNAGTTALPWEPYVGGISSPNPNDPQDIHSNGDSGSIEYGVYGGNLFDATITTNKNTTVENEVITFNVDTTDDYLVGSYGGTTPLINIQSGNYCVSCSDTNVRVTMYCVINGAYVNIDSTLSPITVSADTFIQGIRVRSINGTSLKGKPFTIMFNKGTLALPYEPYTKQPLILQTQNGLGGLKVTLESEANYKDADGNLWACDYIDLNRGKRVQRIVEGVLDGSQFAGFLNGNVWHFTDISIFGVNVLHAEIKEKPLYYVASDRFLFQSQDYQCAVSRFAKMMYFNASANSLSLRATDLFETQNDAGFYKFFQEHPTKFYAIRTEPIETDLTEEEIAQYKALMMNYPNTTIINDANAYTEVEYVADTKCYIDNKFKELEIALASTNANLL